MIYTIKTQSAVQIRLWALRQNAIANDLPSWREARTDSMKPFRR